MIFGRIGNNFLIESATPQDIPAIMSLEKVLFNDPWSVSHFKQALGHPQQFLWVAKTPEDLMGYVVGWQTLDELHLLNVAVAPLMQRQGVGLALLTACFDRFPSVHRFFLETRHSNLAALKLYQKAGFVPLSVRKKYYPDGEDALVMVRQVRK